MEGGLWLAVEGGLWLVAEGGLWLDPDDVGGLFPDTLAPEEDKVEHTVFPRIVSYEKFMHVIWREKLREHKLAKVRPEVSLWKAENSSNHDCKRIYRIWNIPEDEEVELAEPAAAAAEQPLGPHDVETAAGELGT